MRLFPQLVLEKYVERIFDVLVPGNRIVGGSKIIDQVVQPHLFLRAEIKYWSVISFDVPHFEIIIILVRKTKRRCRNCNRKKSTHSRRYGRATPLFSSHFFFLRHQARLGRIGSTRNLAAWLIKKWRHLHTRINYIEHQGCSALPQGRAGQKAKCSMSASMIAIESEVELRLLP
jgi:hypothetical protein